MPPIRQEVTRHWRPLRLRLAWLSDAVLRRMMLRAWRALRDAKLGCMASLIYKEES